MTGFRNALLGAAGAAGGGGYSVDNSMVLDDGSSQYLSGPVLSSGSERIGTYSFWTKRGNLGTQQEIYTQYRTSSSNLAFRVRFLSGDTLDIVCENDAGSVILRRTTTQVFRDPHAFLHVHIQVDGNQTDDTCCTLTINGSAVSDFSTKTNLSSGTDLNLFTSGKSAFIGSTPGPAGYYDGYFSEFVAIDNSNAAATSFGEYDTNGVWRPIDVSGLTFGTNGFYLDFAASGDLGNDVSGNANDFTTSGSPTQSSDTPTNNFANLSSITQTLGGAVTLSNGNLNAAGTAAVVWNRNPASIKLYAAAGGKYIFAVKPDAIGGGRGDPWVTNEDYGGGTNPTTQSNAWACTMDTTSAFYEYDQGTGTNHTMSPAAATGDYMLVAIDLDNLKLWFGRYDASAGVTEWADNGTGWTGDPTDGGTTACATLTGNEFTVGVSLYTGRSCEVDFGQRSDILANITIPTGYGYISSSQIYTNAAPAVADVSDGFVQTTNTEANIVSALASARSAHTNYIEIYKNLDAVEEWVVKFSDDTGNFMSFNDNDAKATFPTLAGSNVWLGASLRVGSTYGVYTTTVSHTNGSDTDSAHGLTSSTGRYACIVKRESTGGGDWYLDHPSLTSGYNIVFGSASAAVEQNSTVYADVDATNGTVLSAAPTGTYRVIVFAEVPGFLELPDWTGNSSSDGPLVNLALGPTFGIFKTYKTTTGDWIVHSVAVDDNTAAGNPRNTRLILNGTQSDSTDYAVDYGANFFKARDSQNAINASVPMLGILIGQASFGSSPATAR